MADHSHSYTDTSDVSDQIGMAQEDLAMATAVLDSGTEDLAAVARHLHKGLSHVNAALRGFLEAFNEYRREPE